MAVETRYFCNGSDRAVVTKKEYEGGLTACGNNTCTLYQHPFEKGLFCTTCGKRIGKGEETEHQH